MRGKEKDRKGNKKKYGKVVSIFHVRTKNEKGEKGKEGKEMVKVNSKGSGCVYPERRRKKKKKNNG